MWKQILFGGESGLSSPANLGLTSLRVFTGAALALGHGINKLPPSEKFVEGTANMGFPFPAFFSWAAGVSEFVGGWLLALGFLTRVSTFFIALTLTVALIGRHWYDPFNRKELAFLYFFVAIAFLLKGAGDWSIDAIFRKNKSSVNSG